ncbi:hypothetical protein ACCO45_001116 [Purpureocillium lilacinum]|uniref:Uncharacterized protein n=1 Tax=Purpureocillium lilacinum TaxID=33203 RepID=A0ACC4E7G9_PURLI
MTNPLRSIRLEVTVPATPATGPIDTDPDISDFPDCDATNKGETSNKRYLAVPSAPTGSIMSSRLRHLANHLLMDPLPPGLTSTLDDADEKSRALDEHVLHQL